MNKKEITINQAASIMGKKGGKKTGPTKARQGTSVRIKAWWASEASIPYRSKKTAPEAIPAQGNAIPEADVSCWENPGDCSCSSVTSG